MAEVVVTICTTCRAGQPTDDEGPRPGSRLYQALSGEELPEGVRLRPVECLSACKRGCSRSSLPNCLLRNGTEAPAQI